MPQAPKNKPHTALTPYSIGMKLKTLRTEKGLTLSRLGAEVGLSTALLSKLESEFMIPTLPTLAKIAHAYGVDLAFFFSTVQRHSLAITRKAHISADRRDLPRARGTKPQAPRTLICAILGPYGPDKFANAALQRKVSTYLLSASSD